MARSAENLHLRRSADAFGDLAERLNVELRGPASEGQSAFARDVQNATARIRILGHTDRMSTQKKPASSPRPQSGDVLVSHSTAVREHDISIVPSVPHAVSRTHDEAVTEGRSEADARRVDAWLTEDHTHMVKIASHRAPVK